MDDAMLLELLQPLLTYANLSARDRRLIEHSIFNLSNGGLDANDRPLLIEIIKEYTPQMSNDVMHSNLASGNTIHGDLNQSTQSGGVAVHNSTIGYLGKIIGGDEIHYHSTIDVPAPPPPSAPPLIDGFVGRTALVTRLIKQLNTNHGVMIIGEPRAGKTQLAAKLVTQIVAPKRIFWHTFSPNQATESMVWLLAGFLAHHGMSTPWKVLHQQSTPKIPLVSIIQDYIVPELVTGNFVICLDDGHVVDVESLKEVTQYFNPLVSAGKLDLILTIRRPLMFNGLIAPTVITGLDRDEARLLLQQRSLTLTDELFDTLYDKTEGNTELLTLAITVLQQTRNVSELITQLTQTDLIEEFLLSHVYGQLGVEERPIMKAIAMLLGDPATTDSIDYILEEETSESTLRILSHRYLLIRQNDGTGFVYRQHTMVQEFFYKLLSTKEKRTMHRRAAHYFESEERDFLRATQHYMAIQEYSDAVRLTTHDIWAFINRGQGQALSNILTVLADTQLSPEVFMNVILTHADMLVILAANESAERHYQLAFDTLNAEPTITAKTHYIAHICRGMSQVFEQKEPEKALMWVQRGLDQLSTDDTKDRAILHIRKGTLLNVLEQSDGDEDIYEINAGLELLPAEETEWRANAFNNLCVAYWTKNHVADAKDAATLALKAYQQLKQAWGITAVHHNLATLSDIAGDWQTALQQYKTALDLSERLGLITRQVPILLGLGILSLHQGDLEFANRSLHNAMNLARKYSLQEHQIASQCSYAELLLQTGNWQSAESLLLEAEALEQARGTADQKAEIYRLLALVELYKDDQEQAILYVRQSLQEADSDDKSVERAKTFRVMGRMLCTQHKYTEAEAVLKESIQLLEESEPYELAVTKVMLGEYLITNEIRHEEGKSLLLEARSTFSALGANLDSINVERILASYA